MSHLSAPWTTPAPLTVGGRPVPPAGERPAAGPAPVPRIRPYFYHRLALTDPRHRWWKPLVEGVILVGLYLVVSILLGIVLAVAVPQSLSLDLDAMDQSDPAVFFVLFASVALLLPCVLVARLVMGPRPLGLIFSVAGRIRWRWLLTCALVAVGVYAVVNAAGIGLDLLGGATATPVRPLPGFWWFIATILLVVPLQCAAEELVFRGYLAQTVGRWLKHPAWAILLPVPLFVLGHAYDLWGQLSVGIMAVAMGIVTWRTGGLEAGIALHAVNNMSISLFAALGLVDMNETSGAPTDLITELILNGAYVALVFRLARRRPSLAVTRTVVLPPPPAPPRLPDVRHRPAALAGDRSGLAAYPVDPASGAYLTLPPQYGPYTVRDGQGRFVGVLDTRPAAPQAPTYTGPHDGQH
ncbi:CPBP family intramembrane glutamic endopeptidase [Kocuria sp.]|uniref:CPBP family intramembrane glutamic endopeptidase n=1 Tax=Kocuria sp. TaxID=1871328 RepID=UPI0026DD985A|nr:type II CAAX endopeptidase family protein [Kocuria sp.]MDO4919162.1 type II CAAX endopeptidase family protein [Kocuria sp.]